MSELLACGHPMDKGSPATVIGDDGVARQIMGWRFVLDWDGETRICHACADKRVLDCGHTPSPHSDISTGYGTTPDGKRHCYACCAKAERESLIADGKGVLYLSKDGDGWKVGDWSGHLTFTVGRQWKERTKGGKPVHCARFTGPDGEAWIGRQTGDDNQICRVRRMRPGER